MVVCADDLLERSTARAKKRQKVYRHAQFMPLPSQIPAESLHGSKVSVGYAAKNGRNFTGARSLCRLRSKKRQKLYARVKKRSATHQKTAKTLHERGQKARTESAEPEEATETVQSCKGKVDYAPKSGRNFTRV